MIRTIRERYNEQFSPAQYSAYIAALSAVHNRALDFRVAETPVFVDRKFRDKLLSACEAIVDVITSPSFEEQTRASIPPNVKVPGDEGHADFIAFDFGVCENAAGELEPQLIEMQGFPSLFCYQMLQDEMTRQYFEVPDNYSMFLGGFDREKYLQVLKDIIIGDEQPEHVVLLEILPHQQKTRIDFYCTREYLGIEVVCLTDLIHEGKKLFYLRDGIKTQVKRIYNRVIFDDLDQQSPAVQEKGKLFFAELDVKWMPHPHWFYRISKFTLPLIRHPYIPETYFLHQLESIPQDLENYVLKPLFSFAGQGVVIDVTPADIQQIRNKENWILQRKVRYADVIPTPDIPAKAEIRIFYFWPRGASRPVAAGNLARLSKGKMIGVRYNKDKEWVGGSLAYFEKN